MAVGDEGLSAAIRHYADWVNGLIISGTMLPPDEWNAPLFTYVMTKKQFNRLNFICQRNGWPVQTCRGITFYPRNIKHILTARKGKDSIHCTEVADILIAALCPQSQVELKRDQNQQVVVLNSVSALRVGAKREKYFGMMIVQVSENDLAPVTAYHATEAKIRAIMKDGE